MAFDAGEIIAYLRLDRSKFDEGLDEARAKADAWSKEPVDLPVKPELDDKAVADVEAEKEVLATPVEFEVKPVFGEGAAKLAAETVIGDLTSAIGTSGYGGLLAGLLGAGATSGELVGGLRNLGLGAGEAKSIVASFLGALGTGAGGASGADSAVKALLPAPADMNAALARWLFASFPEHSGAIPLGSGASGGGSFVETLIADAIFGPGQDIGFNSGSGNPEVAVKRDIMAMLGQLASGGAGVFDSFSGGNSGFTKAIFNPIGASAGVAFLGAFGAAISGGLAATIIGSAGTMAALLPGFLDLMKGYAAYQAISTGASTKGMSAGAIGLGHALGGLFGAGKGGLGAAENQIMPQIEKFIGALTKAIPLMGQFAKPAIAAMTGFFNAIDRGLGSGGFKSFVGSMSKVVGPIMTEFGKVILNLAGAFGGFLKLFAGVGAKEIGPWFVKITGELNHFLNHVKLGHGFVSGMVTVFSNLGKILGTMWTAVKLLADALAPLGLQVFRIIGWLAVWAGRILKMVPPQVIVTLATFFVTLITVAKGIALVSGAMEFLAANPVALVIAGIVAVIVIAYELYKHWHTVWGFIKRIALDAWHFLDAEIFQPIERWLGPGIKADLDAFQKIWGVVWGALHIVVKGAWDVIKPIFDAIKTGIGDIIKAVGDALGALGKIAGFAGKVGGGIVNGFVHGIGSVLTLGGLRANGGPAQAGTPYIVGEQGPELFVPSQSGTVVPNGKFGGQTIVFNINAQGHSSPEAVVGAVRGAIGATLPSLQAALARGAA